MFVSKGPILMGNIQSTRKNWIYVNKYVVSKEAKRYDVVEFIKKLREPLRNVYPDVKLSVTIQYNSRSDPVAGKYFDLSEGSYINVRLDSIHENADPDALVEWFAIIILLNKPCNINTLKKILS